MNKPGKSFPSGPGGAGNEHFTLSGILKTGSLLGLLVICAVLFFHQGALQGSCETSVQGNTTARDYLMLKIGGFSAEIEWSTAGC
jgi:hypothetical protein